MAACRPYARSHSSPLPRLELRRLPSQAGLVSQGAEPESQGAAGGRAPWHFPSLCQALEAQSHLLLSTLSHLQRGKAARCNAGSSGTR